MAPAPKDKKPTPIGQVTLKDVVLAFPHFDKPTASIKDGPLKYRGDFIMDPNDKIGARNIAACEKAIEAVKAETYKDKASRVKFKEGRFCLCDGNENTDKEFNIRAGYEDMQYVFTANDKRPPLVDRLRNPITDPQEIREVFYGGCHVNAVVRFYSITNEDKGGDGMFASIEALQWYRDGERFGGAGVDVDDVFNILEDDADEDDLFAE